MQPQPDPVRELFFDAKHVGEAREPKFTGRGASFECGAVARVSLHLDEAQRIVDAKFKAAGCSVLVAATSLLIDAVLGKTTAEAAAICQSSPQLSLGKLDAEKMSVRNSLVRLWSTRFATTAMPLATNGRATKH